jgi:hypothetical protein
MSSLSLSSLLLLVTVASAACSESSATSTVSDAGSSATDAASVVDAAAPADAAPPASDAAAPTTDAATPSDDAQAPATDAGSSGTTEERCTSTGGTVGSALCCMSASDFPNSCLIGACGCAPNYSKDTKTCSCPAGKCFDPSAGCIAR